MRSAATHLHPEDNRQTAAKAHPSLANTEGLDKHHLSLVNCLTGGVGDIPSSSRARCLFFCDRCPKYLDRYKREKIYTTGFLLSVIADDGKVDLQVCYRITNKPAALRIIQFLNVIYQHRRACPVFTTEQATRILNDLPRPLGKQRR